MKLLGAVLTALAVLFVAPASAAAPGTFGVLLHVPPGPAPDSGWPLVVMLHGATGNGPAFEQQTGMSAVADAHGFVVAYLSAPGGRWGAGWCCVERDGDVSAILTATEQVGEQVPIDTSRRFLAGWSNGGMMTWRVACQAPGTFSAYAVVSGSPVLGYCSKTPYRMYRDHGTYDTTVPYAGGTGYGTDGNSWRYPSPWKIQVLTPRGSTMTNHVHAGGHAWPSGLSEALVTWWGL